MARYTLKRWEYTYNALLKAITLLPPFDEIDVSQIISIRNTTRNEALYLDNKPANTISITNGIITHTYDNSQHDDLDNLQIVIDAEFDFTNLDRAFGGEPVAPGQPLITSWFNIEGYKNIGLYLKSTMAFSWAVEVADDPGENPDSYTVCDGDGTVLPLTTVGAGDPIQASGKYIPLTVKGSQMRIIGLNMGVSTDTPYCGVK